MLVGGILSVWHMLFRWRALACCWLAAPAALAGWLASAGVAQARLPARWCWCGSRCGVWGRQFGGACPGLVAGLAWLADQAAPVGVVVPGCCSPAGVCAGAVAALERPRRLAMAVIIGLLLPLAGGSRSMSRWTPSSWRRPARLKFYRPGGRGLLPRRQAGRSAWPAVVLHAGWCMPSTALAYARSS